MNRHTRGQGLAAVALSAALPVLAGEAAHAVDRTRPPVPGPVKPMKFPPVVRFALTNGLEIRLVEAHAVPIVTVLLVVRTGAASDPPGQEGLAAMTARMLDEGAGGRGALALEDELATLGATVETAASWDGSTVSLFVPTARLAAALPLMADVALRPGFPAKELDRLRTEALTNLLLARSEPGQIASRALGAAVFGGSHRYGRPAAGSAATIPTFTPEALRAFHAAHYRPGNAALIVVGDVTRESVSPLLEKAFGGWPAGGSPPPPPPTPAPLNERTVWIVDKPGAEQSVILIGRVGPPRSTPDHAALETMNTLLGGSFTSRLNDNLREKKGYTYGASSQFDYRRTGGLFVAGAAVQTAVTGPALAEILKELKAIGQPPTETEAARARDYLALSFPREFETTGEIASRIGTQVVYDLPPDVWDAFVPKVLATGPAAMTRAAKRTVDPARLAIVVVGDRKTVEKAVRAAAPGPVRLLSVDDVLGPAPVLAP
jgi:predicted Zn-dependent peptidase